MDLISSVAALIAAGTAAVVGHFIAHDLYEEAPRHARRLLDQAVTILPQIDRERYSEEWLAHLHECTGVMGKFRHAIECLLIAWKLRKIVEERSHLEFDAVEFIFSPKGHGVLKVSMNAYTALPVVTVMLEVLQRKVEGNREKYKPSDELRKLLADPRVTHQKIYEVRDAIAKVKGVAELDFDLRFVDRLVVPYPTPNSRVGLNKEAHNLHPLHKAIDHLFLAGLFERDGELVAVDLHHLAVAELLVEHPVV
jgi:hypothetical protein